MVGRGDEQGGEEAARLVVWLRCIVGGQLWKGVSGEAVCIPAVWGSGSRIGFYLGREGWRYLVLSGVSFCPDLCLFKWEAENGQLLSVRGFGGQHLGREGLEAHWIGWG